MAREEFSKCPECGVGTLRPTGEVAKMTDPDTGTVTRDYREYKCDNCGYPDKGKAKVATVSELVGADEGGRNNNNQQQQQQQQQPEQEVKPQPDDQQGTQPPSAA
jgi:hypothetical protein